MGRQESVLSLHLWKLHACAPLRKAYHEEGARTELHICLVNAVGGVWDFYATLLTKPSPDVLKERQPGQARSHLRRLSYQRKCIMELLDLASRFLVLGIPAKFP